MDAQRLLGALERALKTGITIIDICIAISVLMIMFAGSIEREADRCRERAISMNAFYRWSPSKGCMIEVKPGRWVPLANYREVP